MFGTALMPSFKVRTTTINKKTGSKIAFRDEFPVSQKLSSIIDYVLNCKSGRNDVALIEIRITEGGGLSGSFWV